MKILFVCAGGMSTGLIVKKMEKWAEQKGVELKVHACGVGSYERQWQEYDCILVGPQVRYVIPKMKEIVKIPVSQIETKDYGMQNVDAIFKLAYKITGQELPK